jgi:hypothetical protein
MSLRHCNSGVRRRASACLYHGRKPGQYGTVTPFARVLVPILASNGLLGGAIADAGQNPQPVEKLIERLEPKADAAAD